MANKLIPNNNNDINTQYKNIITPANIDLLENDTIESFVKNQIDKIVSIDEQIVKLNNIEESVKNSKKLQEILPKYITFLEYIKKIIQVKIIKDITIVKLINDVFTQVDDVIDKMGDYGMYKPKNYNSEIGNLQKRKKDEIEKIYLVDIGKINYNTNINKNIRKLENCTISITRKLKDAIGDFEKAVEPIPEGGAINTFSLKNATKPFYNALTNQTVFDKINNSPNIYDENSLNTIKDDLISKHTESLNKLKEKYEEGLQTNIDDFKNICEALKTLISRIQEITGKLISKKTKVIELNKKNRETLNAQIAQLSGQRNPVTIKGLKISDFEDANVFTQNHTALSGLLGEIKNKQSKLKDPPHNTPQGPGQQQEQQQQQQQVQGQDKSNTASVATIGSNISRTSSVISNATSVEIGDDITDILNTVQEDDINNVSEETLNQLDDISEKIIALQEENDYNYLINNLIDPPPTPQQPIADLPPYDIKRYNSIVERINNAGSRVQQISIFIYVMKKYVNADKIKEKLNLAVRDKGLFTGTSEIVLQKINTANGGKYKMKKSKKSKSKSKTTKTTPKKAKSTKKQKAPKTQTKSYNNPKYKNQDGGFVRGGVLFPESFYRSDIVM